jgi:hypothetical protein
MPRTADSLQNIWQKRFRDYQLAYPFTADPQAGIRYQKLDTQPVGGTISSIPTV